MRASSKGHYAWVVASVTFFVLLLGAGVRATPSILIVPLENEFAWSPATISASIAVNIFLFGMVGPFAVAVMERFGIEDKNALGIPIPELRKLAKTIKKKNHSLALEL